jgi:hypothetical protein
MKNSLYKIHNKTQVSRLNQAKISSLDIFLLPEDFNLSSKYFERYGADFIQKTDRYFEQLSKDTPPPSNISL